jgi:hypothetical protein
MPMEWDTDKEEVKKIGVPHIEFSTNDVVNWIEKFIEHFDQFSNSIDNRLKAIEDKLDVPDDLQLRYLCCLCGKLTRKLVRHHYSYFPEKTILVCPSCNNRHNLEIKHPLLNPFLEDANKFYGHKDTEEIVNDRNGEIQK